MAIENIDKMKINYIASMMFFRYQNPFKLENNANNFLH